MTILIFILILSFLVLIHELGHYLIARKNGIAIKEFGLGYPPRLLKLFTYKGTIFSLNLLPLGGFVQLDGEDGPETISDEKKIVGTKSEKNQGIPLYLSSTSAQLQTVLAGIVVNLLFAIVAFTVIFAQTGIPIPLTNQVRIGQVMPGSPADQVLPENSNIIAVKADQDWLNISDIASLQDFVMNHRGQQIQLRLQGPCENENCQSAAIVEKSIYVRTAEETPAEQGAMGIAFSDVYYKNYPWYQMPFYAAYYGTKQAVQLAVLIVQSLGGLVADLFAGKNVGGEVAGPVGIVHQASVYGFFEGGFLNIVNFAALLSVNLGIMNLLPIPALDGGRAVFIILEKLFPKQKVKKFSYYANYFGFIALLLAMALISANDIWQIFHGQ